MTIRLTVALCLVVVLSTDSASGSYPKAQNVTWKSTNFKTFLTWEPEPSADYSYTVEFSAVGRDKQRSPHCTRSSKTDCDLSSFLTDLKACYKADVISTPPLGASSDLTEFPYSSSTRFCPYQETDLGRPEFKLEVNGNKRSTTLYVTDPLTAVFKDGRQLNLRDIFADELQYKVTYRRNQSTGKKTQVSKTNVIEVTNLDKGESYCFNIQAYIPGRDISKQYGALSVTQCSDKGEEYSAVVIAAAIFLILLLLGVIITVTVICCKRRKKALGSKKEGLPLRDV
ncbi:coagulation factor IIIa [Xyrichtys novacula]|uniref:Tissue factor n=1 Tax=Xyrichtys novacula TaxID=13765 RepID=A0AAV1H827_XYRNO|nr:coagulation factor IIIa [Xyrichtys novacula]